jgi:hypothetical protein
VKHSEQRLERNELDSDWIPIPVLKSLKAIFLRMGMGLSLRGLLLRKSILIPFFLTFRIGMSIMSICSFLLFMNFLNWDECILLRATLILFLIFFFGVAFSSCERPLKRPYAYVYLGFVDDFKSSITYKDDLNLAVHKSKEGFSVMSTLDSHTLIPLKRIELGDHIALRNPVQGFLYEENGKSIDFGDKKSKKPLDYYRIIIDTFEGRLALFAAVGIGKPATWHAKIPQVVQSLHQE